MKKGLYSVETAFNLKTVQWSEFYEIERILKIR